jgi:hypothetical protein
MKDILLICIFFLSVVAQPVASQTLDEQYAHKFDSIELNTNIREYLSDYHRILSKGEYDRLVNDIQVLLIKYFDEKEMILLDPPNISVMKYYGSKTTSYVLEISVKVGEKMGSDISIVIYATSFMIYKYDSTNMTFTSFYIYVEAG